MCESPRLNRGGSLETGGLSAERKVGIPSVAVKCVEIGGTPVAKATFWSVTDAEARSVGSKTGLDTLVSHAVTR